MKLLAVQVHCSESTQQWWTNETLSIKQQLLFIATQCCRLNCRDAHRCTKVDALFYESVQRKCAHRCTKVCTLFEVAVELSRKWQPVHYRGVCTSLVHYRSIIAATTVQRCTVMLSQCCNIINMHSVNYHHCVCTSWRSSSLAHYRSSTVALLSYLDHVAILHHHALTILSRCHKVALHTISNRAFIATLETIVVLTENVYPLFSMVYISPMSNVLYNVDVRTM